MKKILKISDLDQVNVTPLTMIFLIHRRKILTLHRAKNKKIYPDHISGFGGKVEPGENLRDSAKREFFEETGLKLKDLTLRGTFIRATDENFVSLLYIFFATSYSGKLKKITDEGAISWMTIDDFIDHPKTVDHIKKYLKELIFSTNFYTGFGYYKKGKMQSYADSVKYFKQRVNLKRRC